VRIGVPFLAVRLLNWGSNLSTLTEDCCGKSAVAAGREVTRIPPMRAFCMVRKKEGVEKEKRGGRRG
jgi:hypothetical protein